MSNYIDLSGLKKLDSSKVVVWGSGAEDYKTGAVGSVCNLLEDYPCNHHVEVEKGILKDECEQMLSSFFKDLRKLKSKK